MKVLTKIEIAQELAKSLKKPILYLSFEWCEDYDEIVKAAPYLNFDDHTQAICDGIVYIICDSEEEMNNLYDRTVGDNGPTELNSYDGKERVYALTINADGVTENENT